MRATNTARNVLDVVRSMNPDHEKSMLFCSSCSAAGKRYDARREQSRKAHTAASVAGSSWLLRCQAMCISSGEVALCNLTACEDAVRSCSCEYTSWHDSSDVSLQDIERPLCDTSIPHHQGLLCNFTLTPMSSKQVDVDHMKHIYV